MSDQQLIDYISAQLNSGRSIADIKEELRIAGWDDVSVSKAFASVVSNRAPDVASSFEGVFADNKKQAGKVQENSGDLNQITKSKILRRKAGGIFRKNWLTFVGIMLIPALLFVSVQVVIGWMVENEVMSGASRPAMIASLIALSVLTLIMIISKIWGYTALIIATREAGEMGIGEAYKRARSRSWSFAWVLLLVGVIVMLGGVAFILPGLILLFIFQFAHFVVIAERKGGMSALVTSREYIRGNVLKIIGRWWGAAWVLIIWFTLAFLIITAMSIVGLYYGTLAETILRVGLLTLFADLLVMPFLIIYHYLLYTNIRHIKGEIKIDERKAQKVIYWILFILGVIWWIWVVVGAVALYRRAWQNPIPGAQQFQERFTPFDSNSL